MGKDLIAAARALILLAEKKKLDTNSEGYAVVQTLKDEISLFELAQIAEHQLTAELVSC